MAGTVTRKSQAIPVSTASQGVGTVGGSGTPLDTTEQPYVILLDESNPARVVRPSGVDIPQPVMAATAPAAAGAMTGAVTAITATGLGGYTSTLVTLQSGTWTNLSIVFEGSDDGLTWYGLWATNGTNNLALTADTPNSGLNSFYLCDLRGFTSFRVRNLNGASMTGSATITIWPRYGGEVALSNVRLWDGTDISQVTPAGGLNVSPLGKTRVYPLSPDFRNNTTSTIAPQGFRTVTFATTVDEVLVQNNSAVPVTVVWGTGLSPLSATAGDLQIIGGQSAFVSLDYRADWVSVYNSDTSVTLKLNQGDMASVWIAGGTRP